MASLLQACWLHFLVAFCVKYLVSCGQCPTRVNLALNKPTTQSSTQLTQGAMGESRKAVDGVTSGGMVCQSCSSTDMEPSPWWMVDLEAEFFVAEVVISNRNVDSVANRLRNFIIEVASSLEEDGSLSHPVLCAGRADSQATYSTVSYPCQSGPISGRYVRVTIQHTEFLSLCEVQVFGPSNDSDNRNSGLACSDIFTLYQTDLMPSDPPFYSTSTMSPMFCSSLCLTMDMCASFTLNTTDHKLWECRLFKCKMSRLDTVYGSRYFLQSSLFT